MRPQLLKELWDEFTERMGGPPELVPDAYERASGHSQAWKIRSPVLLLSGDADYLPHSLTMAAALVKAKKSCEIAFYRNAWHTFWWNRADIPAFAAADATVLAFLRKHLRG